MKGNRKKITIISAPLHVQMERQLEANEGHRMRAEELPAPPAPQCPPEDYVPFGNDWANEMMRWRKPDLVRFLQKALQEKKELAEMVGEAAGLIAFNRMKKEANAEQSPIAARVARIMSATLKDLKDLQDSGIGFYLRSYSDGGGFRAELEDIDGRDFETGVDPIHAAVDWLKQAALKHYPKSLFAIKDGDFEPTIKP